MTTPAAVAARRQLIKSCNDEACRERVLALEQTLKEAFSSNEFTARRARAALLEIGIVINSEEALRATA